MLSMYSYTAKKFCSSKIVSTESLVHFIQIFDEYYFKKLSDICKINLDIHKLNLLQFLNESVEFTRHLTSKTFITAYIELLLKAF